MRCSAGCDRRQDPACSGRSAPAVAAKRAGRGWAWLAGPLLLAPLALGVGAVRAEGIVDVLDRSQAQRLARLDDPAQGAPRPVAVATIEASFQRLLAAMDESDAPDPPDAMPTGPSAGRPGPRLSQRATLKVVRGEPLAETLHGRLIVVDERLADLPEGERLFVLAHELGHVALNHWATIGRLYQQHVPSEVMRPQTDAVADLLGREASVLAHRHEFDADAYGLRALQRLGHGAESVVSLFTRLGVQRDTATHPGTRKRLALLRSAP